MKKLLPIIVVLLISFSALKVSGQSGNAIWNPIPIGTISEGGSYTDTQMNVFPDGSGWNSFEGTQLPDVFYQFTIANNETVDISHCGSNLDTFLYLLDSSGNTIASNDDNGPLCAGTTASLEVFLPAGTYTVISSAAEYQIGNITTTISVLARGISGSSTDVPINVPQMSPFFDTYNNDPSNGFINQFGLANNVIYHKFTVTNALRVNISLSGSTTDTYLYLIDANNNVIPSNSNDVINAPLSAYLAPGDYYAVSGGAGNSIGNITTTITLDSQLANNTFSDAIFAGTFGNCSGGSSYTDTKSINSYYGLSNYMGLTTNDVYYYFYVKSPTMINVSHCGSGMDSYIHILQFDGTEITSNGGNGILCPGSTSASLQVPLPAGGYWVVSEGAGGATGNLTTTINATPIAAPAPDGASRYTAIDLGTLMPNVPQSRTYTPTDCYEPVGNPGDWQQHQIYYKFTVASSESVVMSGSVQVFDNAGQTHGSTVFIPGTYPGTYSYVTTAYNLSPGVTYYATVAGFPLSSPIVTTFNVAPVYLPSPGPLVLNCSPLSSAPSANQNYISTYIPRQPFSDAGVLAAKNICEVNQTVQYFDGLGRPIQTVQTKASPSGNDIVQPVAYDQYGREVTKYLPYTQTAGTPGAYRPNALSDVNGSYLNSEQYSFYHPQAAQNYAAVNTPSASVAFESSPLNRVTEQGATGNEWQLTGTTTPDGSTAGGHTVKMVYASNDGSTYWARQFGVTIDATTGLRSLVDQGVYAVNQLFVTVYQDENWMTGQSDPRLNTIEEYKDKEGHVVLKRTYNMNGTTFETLSLYYVYDDFGNLSYVLPPKAEADGGLSSSANPAIITNLCYQYNYDERNRLIQKRIPGKDWEYMVYNSIDQVVATQDGNQRNNGQWIITKYDALGRAVVNGIWNNNMDPVTLKGNVYAQSINWENRDNSQAQTYGYTLTNTYPNTLNAILSVNYYDDYNIPNLPSVYDHHAQNSQMTKGQQTASLTTVLNTIGNTTPDMLWTVNYYDDKGRATDVYVQHYLGGTLDVANYDRIQNTYNDITNEVMNNTRTHYTSTSGTNPAVTIANSYVYDHMGRKRQSWNTINNQSPVLISQIDYNETGQVYQRHLHSEDSGTSYLQGITNAYNERGWLTNSSTDGNLFNMSLNYNNPGIGIIPQWNGNISAMGYNVNNPTPATKQFLYTYDALDRLINATSTGNQLDEQISYDKMGNILSMNRGGSSAINISYNYQDANGNYSNQLAEVNKVSNNSTFRTYAYDGNGNATSDGVNQTIKYNILNLPQSIVQGVTTKATYTYEANGSKIRNTGSDGSWDYINGIVYQTPIGSTNTTISFIQTEEGRATRNASDGIYHYEYTLMDHLGNTRVSFDKGTIGSARVIQESEYYSFGLQRDILHNDNRYLYNGKEIQTDLTDQYDYGARLYDPVIGRWSVIDPMAERSRRFSPYAYANDNPVCFIDVNGMFSWSGFWHAVGSGIKTVLTDMTIANGGIGGISYNFGSTGAPASMPNSASPHDNALSTSNDNSPASTGATQGSDNLGTINYTGDSNTTTNDYQVGQDKKPADQGGQQGGFPSFAILWANYPCTNAQGAHSFVLPQSLYDNQCAIRLGYDIVQSGGKLTNYKSFGNVDPKTGYPRGATDLATWLSQKAQLGAPIPFSYDDFVDYYSSHAVQGIIYELPNGGPAHIDLIYNGNRAMPTQVGEQFYKTRTIWYWPIK